MMPNLSHVWKPSRARLVTIDSFVPVPRGGATVTPPPLSWPAKDPADVLDYVLDISPAIIGNDGDGILTATVTIVPSNPGDLEVRSMTADGSCMVLWLAGGQADIVYTVTFNMNTIASRCIQRSIVLPVVQLSSPIIPSTAILATKGVMITDQNGNPVLS